MAQILSPSVDDNDEILEAMQKLFRNSQVTRSAHFIAMQRKERKLKIMGVLVVILNILITSGLVETYFESNQYRITLTIKLLSFLAAALAGVQGFFNFQKTVECHTKSGSLYSSINHRLGLNMAEYEEDPPNRPARIEDFKKLQAEHLKANDDAAACIPSDADFDKARRRIEARERNR